MDIFNFFFFSFYVSSVIVEEDFPFSYSDIFKSYSFYSGIGFVWILKVYIILALITPLGLSLSKSSMSGKSYFVSITIVYVIYELGIYLFFDSIPLELREFASNIFLVVVPYLAIYFYGLRAHTLNDKTLLFVVFFSLLVSVVLVIEKRITCGFFVPTQQHKFPPTLYYLAYAFFCVNLIYYVVDRHLTLIKIRVVKSITWLSSNSLWIYLWHIMAFYLWFFFAEDFVNSHTGHFAKFFTKALFLLLFGVALTYVQTKLVDNLLPRSKPRFKGILLLLK